jgi:hypothetical protein
MIDIDPICGKFIAKGKDKMKNLTERQKRAVYGAVSQANAELVSTIRVLNNSVIRRRNCGKNGAKLLRGLFKSSTLSTVNSSNLMYQITLTNILTGEDKTLLVAEREKQFVCQLWMDLGWTVDSVTKQD